MKIIFFIIKESTYFFSTSTRKEKPDGTSLVDERVVGRANDLLMLKAAEK